MSLLRFEMKAGTKTSWLSLVRSKKSRILTRVCPRLLIVVDWLLVPEERERESNQIFGMTKDLRNYLPCINVIYLSSH
jgi:hypothetical protein